MDNRQYREAVDQLGDTVFRIAFAQTHSHADADGTIALSVEGIDAIEITAQLKENGAATGTYQKDGKTYVYKVSGSSGNYHVSVELQ